MALPTCAPFTLTTMFGHTPPAEVPLATTLIVVLPPASGTDVDTLPFDQMSQPLSCAAPVECVIASASYVFGVHEPLLDVPAVPPVLDAAPLPVAPGPVAPPPPAPARPAPPLPAAPVPVEPLLEPVCVTALSVASLLAPPGPALKPKLIEVCGAITAFHDKGVKVTEVPVILLFAFHA